MHSFEVHSNESACRKSGRLGLEQVIYEQLSGSKLSWTRIKTPTKSQRTGGRR